MTKETIWENVSDIHLELDRLDSSIEAAVNRVIQGACRQIVEGRSTSAVTTLSRLQTTLALLFQLIKSQRKLDSENAVTIMTLKTKLATYETEWPAIQGSHSPN